MSHTHHGVLIVAFTAGLIATSTTLRAQRSEGNVWTERQPVTLTACVERGQKDDTFVLTQVADVPVHPPTLGRVVYWLNETMDLRKHVGHQVRINGKVDEVKKGEMEVKLGDDGLGGWSVEMEGPGKDVRATPGQAGVSTPGRDSSNRDLKTTVVKLKVDDVMMVAASCPAR